MDVQSLKRRRDAFVERTAKDKMSWTRGVSVRVYWSLSNAFQQLLVQMTKPN